MAASSEPTWLEVGLVVAGAAAMSASVLVLWRGTESWTGYLFVVLLVLAFGLIFTAGAAWINRQFTDRNTDQ